MVLEVGRLCENLARDSSLRTLLNTEKANSLWSRLAEAVRDGAPPEQVQELLDDLDAEAAAAGVDGIVSADRQFRPLPGMGGFPTAATWRCPHLRRCGRVYPAVADEPAPNCTLTGDSLVWTTVRTG